MKKISHKISIAIVVSVLLLSVLIGSISTIYNVGIVRSNTEANLMEASSRLAEEINRINYGIETKLEDLAMSIADDVDMEQMKNNPDYPSDYTEKIIPLVTKYAESGKINVDCYVNFLLEYSKNGYLIGPNVINLEGDGFKRIDFHTTVEEMESNKSAHDWYYKPIELQHGYWTDPYDDTITKLYMVSYVVPIFVDGEIVGVAGMDIRFNTFQKIVMNAKVYETGYASLLNSNYNFLVHPTLRFSDNLRTVNGGELKEFADYIDQNKNGVFQIKVDGKDKYVGFSTLQNGDVLMVSVESEEVLQDVTKMTLFISIITILGVFLSILTAMYVSKRIATPIIRLKEQAEKITNGDIDVEIEIISNDEIGEFAKAFSVMIKKLRGTYDDLAQKEEELRTQYKELQENEVRIRASDERYRLAIEGSNDAIWEWDLLSGDFTASRRLHEITGHYLNNKYPMKGFNQFIHPSDAERARKDLYDHLKNMTPFYISEYRIKTVDGSYIWVLSRGKALRDKTGRAIKIAGSISDITEKKKVEEEIKFMAFHDILTGLPNRLMFFERLNHEITEKIQRKTKGTVCFIDLDNFKNINDTMGHEAGDQLLIQLAEKLKRTLTSEDLLSRFGGDEFLLLHPYDTLSEEALSYAERILNAVSGHFVIGGKQIFVTASIGVVTYPEDGTDPGSILKNADFAMYKAKELGKNRVAVYDKNMYSLLERETNIERILRGAIEKQELTVHYQPQFDVKNKKISGFEALLRLQSKEMGIISPAEFIPIAEKAKCISQLTRWVLSKACRQAMMWRSEGYQFDNMSVNISSVDLQQPDFVEIIKEVIEETGLPPRILELEITETSLMHSLDNSMKTLQRLMDIGIRVALDDFGTGYSSLNYLRKIPISTLKIDKSFIDNVGSDKKVDSIINNIIGMAHNIDLSVVAEGVEQEHQLSILKEKGCDYMQGYLLCKPLPPDELITSSTCFSFIDKL